MADDIIRFRDPVLVKEGVTDVALWMLIVETQTPMVKMMLKQVDTTGTFIENGETITVRHEGAEAKAFLSLPAYAQILRALPAALVAGGDLPTAADVVPPEPKAEKP